MLTAVLIFGCNCYTNSGLFVFNQQLQELGQPPKELAGDAVSESVINVWGFSRFAAFATFTRQPKFLFG